MPLGSEELDEVVPLALGSDGASDAVARVEEREYRVATARSVGAEERYSRMARQMRKNHAHGYEARSAGDEDVVALGDGRHGGSCTRVDVGVRRQVQR